MSGYFLVALVVIGVLLLAWIIRWDLRHFDRENKEWFKRRDEWMRRDAGLGPKA